jgi:hypothetical protein
MGNHLFFAASSGQDLGPEVKVIGHYIGRNENSRLAALVAMVRTFSDRVPFIADCPRLPQTRVNRGYPSGGVRTTALISKAHSYSPAELGSFLSC